MSHLPNTRHHLYPPPPPPSAISLRARSCRALCANCACHSLTQLAFLTPALCVLVFFFLCARLSLSFLRVTPCKGARTIMCAAHRQQRRRRRLRLPDGCAVVAAKHCNAFASLAGGISTDRGCLVPDSLPLSLTRIRSNQPTHPLTHPLTRI